MELGGVLALWAVYLGRFGFSHPATLLPEVLWFRLNDRVHPPSQGRIILYGKSVPQWHVPSIDPCQRVWQGAGATLSIEQVIARRVRSLGGQRHGLNAHNSNAADTSPAAIDRLHAGRGASGISISRFH